MSNTRRYALAHGVVLILIAIFLAGTTRDCEAQHPGFVCSCIKLPPQVQTILKLADKDFQTRRKTAEVLLGDGVAAWDWLYRACESSDTEIAIAARRMLDQIPFEKELARHVPILEGYRRANISERTRLIIRLGQSTGTEAQVALALLTRFERDEHLSRLAAIELITGPQRPISDLDRWVSTGSRTASRWLSVHAVTAGNFQNFVRRWDPPMKQLIIDPWFVEQPVAGQQMLRWYAEQLLVRGEEKRVHWTVQQVVGSVENNPQAVIETMDWLLLYRQLDACARLVERFPDLMVEDDRLVYRRAELARLNGNLLEAEEVANVVFQYSEEDEHLVRLQSAINLQMAGLNHWACRALQKLLKEPNTQPSVRIQASAMLAELQFQQADFAAAAETLSAAMNCEQPPGDTAVTLLNDNLTSRFHLFSHYAAIDKNNWMLARTHLLDGLEAAPDDSDLLIAMARFVVPDMPEEDKTHWQDSTRELIELALQERAAQIEELQAGYDRDARHRRLRIEALVGALNSFAWLASQTGVNLPQAEAFAREANQLSPANGHVLDTLAACLFAQAKLTEAVVCQQQALRQAPWSQQIRSSLVRYRQAMMLAEMQGLIR